MNKPLISRLALVLGLGLAPLSAGEPQAPTPQGSADPGPGSQRGPRSERMAHRAERMARNLKLTDDQRAKIKAIHEKHRDELKGQRQATHQARKTFLEAAKNPDTPLDQLRKLHQAMSDRSFDMMAARRAVRLETRQVLTPEQREKVAENMGRMEERMERRREHIRGLVTDK